eukprot:3694819-Prymnesium_polylepis.1
MPFHLTMWPGRGYQGSADTQTTQGIVHNNRIHHGILPRYGAHPESRLDVYDFITKPYLPASAHDTGHYPPFSQERL